MTTFDLRSIKRQKITIASFAAAAAMVVATQWPWQGLSLLPLLTLVYVATIWILDFDLKKEEWLVIPLYALAATTIGYIGLVWYTQAPVVRWSGGAIYGMIAYGLLLTLNIINVATVRTIPLVRQALSLMSLAGVAGLFAAYYLFLNLQPNLLEWIAAATTITFLFAWPLVWSSRLGRKTATSHSGSDIAWTALVALIAGELAAVIGLWPVSFMTGLFLSAVASMAIGLVHYQRTRQIVATVQLQYLAIGGALMMVFFLASRWT